MNSTSRKPAPGFEKAAKTRRLLIRRDGAESTQLPGIGYLGGAALFNPNQDVLKPEQLLPISLTVLGFGGIEMIQKLKTTKSDLEREMHIIRKILDIESRPHANLQMLPVCLAAAILEINHPASEIDLPLSQDHLKIVAELSEGQTREQVAATRNLPEQTLSSRIYKMTQQTGSINYACLELAAFMTGGLVMNPDPDQQLTSGQMPVYRTVNVSHNYQNLNHGE